MRPIINCFFFLSSCSLIWLFWFSMNSHSFYSERIMQKNNKSASKWSRQLLCWSFLCYFQFFVSNKWFELKRPPNKQFIYWNYAKWRINNAKIRMNHTITSSCAGLQELFEMPMYSCSQTTTILRSCRLKHTHNQTRSAITITTTAIIIIIVCCCLVHTAFPIFRFALSGSLCVYCCFRFRA